MRRLAALLVTVVGSAILMQLPAWSSGSDKVLEFDTMAPVDGPFVGSANPIRGVNGGGLPWQIEDAKGELTVDGRLEVEVEGLVLLDADPVSPALRGTNPIPSFQAIVSCLTDMDGSVATVNVSSGLFPANTDGDSQIEATVNLPSPCVAPIVFVASPTGMWFSATGQE
jgi:hypothetical protein